MENGELRMENGFSEIARWRDGEMGIEGKNKLYFFYKERKRILNKEKKRKREKEKKRLN
ncbi:MAG TPA: hypothetical protein PLE33_05175 [Candidatus Cloacimonas sp.]|nr:hypothetical protein [Candidatus Cloacimonas sp.]HPS60636.1 hypothetical protein [Candidatus Cloacimonas sp.]